MLVCGPIQQSSRGTVQLSKSIQEARLTEPANFTQSPTETAPDKKPAFDARLQQAAELIERLYLSIDQTESWCQAIDTVAASLCATGWTIWTGDNANPENGRVTTTILDQHKVHEYASTVAAESPLFKRLESLSAERLYTSDQLVPRSEYVAHQFYKDIWKPTGLAYSMGGYIHRDEKRFCIFWFMRDETENRPFQQQDVELLEFLRPHLAQAMQIRDGLRRSQIRARAGMQALDRLKVAMLMLDSENRPVIYNDYADRFVREGVIRIQKDSLSFPGSKPSWFKKLIEQAHEVNCSAALLNNGFETLPGGGESGDVELLLLPHQQTPDSESFLTAPIRSVVFMRHTGQAPTPGLQHLQELFGLTAAEGKVCLALLAGESTRDIAANRGVSLDAIRFHCKSILQKTGNTRRSGLIHTLCLCVANQSWDLNAPG